MARMSFKGNFRTSPVWLGDFQERDAMVIEPAQIDPTKFTDNLGVTVTSTGAVAAGATTFPVTAIVGPATTVQPLIAQGQIIIPVGSLIQFGVGKFARLTQGVLIGDTAVQVEALPTALGAGDVATYSPYNSEYIPSGTLLGKTFTERAAGTPYRPAAVGDDLVYLLGYDIPNAKDIADCELVRHNVVVKENYLPGWSTMSAPLQALVRSLYVTTIGVD